MEGFGSETFRELTQSRVWGQGNAQALGGLWDHGFFADAAPVWGGPALDSHEIVAISRTYSDHLIENPPAGLKVVPLNITGLMGVGDFGTVVAIAVTEATPAADELLTHALQTVPAEMLPYMMSRAMVREGYRIELRSEHNLYISTTAHILKGAPYADPE